MPSDNPCTIDSIGKLIDRGYSLTVYCYGRDCRHSDKLDLNVLARRLGRNHSHLHKHLAPLLRCSRCGGKDIGLQLVPHC